MGKGRPRAVEKGVLGHVPGGASCSSAASTSSSTAASVPQAPVFYPTEEEFADPLAFIFKIRPQAEPFGICRIVPPRTWNPPFALDRDAFTFPTKSQAIDRLQARPPSCDPETFRLEYGRFLESYLGKRSVRRVVFEGEDLDLCRLFNAVKRFGGYDKVCCGKRWAEVARFVRPTAKISECAKHVLCQLYREHLYDYEEYNSHLVRGNKEKKTAKPCLQRKTSTQCVAPVRKRRKGSSFDRVKEAVKLEELDQVCEQCNSGLHGEVMLLCDRCDRGWHLYCLSPPLNSIPSGNWYCLDCINSDKDSFGFVPGKLYTVDAFRRIDDRTRRRWFGQTNISRVQIEKRFWEIVEGRAGEVEVMYGSDLDTSLYGSGFPRANDMIPSSIDPHLWKKYASSPWNLNNLPKLPGSMLRAVHENIAGVMVPWLYIGMLFSSFCWHVEDHCFYSINYLHWGEPKCWYGVPGGEANAFEQVMRKALPDLFEAQPDLLFQLVTMLNPSILLENGVPVYSVLQEPGNFVITFPRSFHGGFNFGLNCAEAVNFAPADWLPHGGVGAELYRFYRKSSVLSHEELLCVAIKSGCDTKSFPYLKQEMQRVFSREKKYREELWVNGIVRSSPMLPKKQPNYVGTEEDPTCIICQQYLYLSAVTCSCRPFTYVCLDHWKHLCECKPDKHHLHYRHTLAELGDLVHMVDFESEMTNVAMILYDRSSAITKRMKDGEISYLQLAEDWLSHSCHILEIPFSNPAYLGALMEAEQFLWADHDMNPVRDMTIKLHEAQKWALDVNSCVHQVESFANSPEKHKEKVSLSELERLLSFQPFPCCLPNFSILKDVVEEAQSLVAEVESALSTSASIGTLDILYTQCTEFSISLPITERLSNEISSAKIWLTNAQSCLMEKRPGVINIDFLNKLKLKMLELHVSLPEMDLLLSLCKDVESWKLRCEEILTGSITMKELEDFLLSADYLTVSIPEIDLLKKYRSDARSWVCHVHSVLQNLNNREDHGNIVIELSNIFKAGDLLMVQVDELSLVEAELKKSRCRENASKALATVMPLGYLQQVLQEASQLEIENEQLFLDASKMLGRAISWEEKAKSAMEKGAHISDFENFVRDSEEILVGLPSLPGIVDALATAQLWISRSQIHLKSSTNVNPADLLKVDELKELISQSKHLKVTVDVADKLQLILMEVEGWEQQSCSLLEDIKSLFYMHQTDIEVESHLSTMIDKLLRNIDYATEVGQSLCYNFKELPELKAASLTLQWCLNAICFCCRIPSLKLLNNRKKRHYIDKVSATTVLGMDQEIMLDVKDIDKFLGDADHLPGVFSDSHLAQMLIKGVTCLRKALCSLPQFDNSTRCSLKEVEVILDEIKEVIIPYPIMVTRLQNAIQKHISWVEEVHAYFQLPRQQPWSSLLELKEQGEADALNCAELDKVATEVGKVENWMSRCHIVLAPILGNDGSLSSKLVQIKDSLNKALGIYRDSEGRQPRGFCVCCPNYSGNEDTYSCLECDDKCHFSCTGSSLANATTMNEYACPFCVYIENGTLPRNGNQSLLSRGDRPEVKPFLELVTATQDLFAGFEELHLVEGIVELARECNFHLTEIVNFTISYNEKDLSSISEKLLSAFKAMAVAGMYDHQDWYIFEPALFRYSWKVKVRKLLKGSRKPVLQQIQRVIKEGAAMGIPSEDHFMKEVAEAKQMSMHWADIAKTVATDSGELALSEVYKLIIEGENLPIHLEKELKALRERSLLYCICRKPNDQRAMIACDQCDEWYHFDCINLNGPLPKTFYCPACRPTDGEFISFAHPICNEESSSIEGGPETPACHRESKHRITRSTGDNLDRDLLDTIDLLDVLRSFSIVDQLWRENKRPLHRTAKRRSKLENLS